MPLIQPFQGGSILVTLAVAVAAEGLFDNLVPGCCSQSSPPVSRRCQLHAKDWFGRIVRTDAQVPSIVVGLVLC